MLIVIIGGLFEPVYALTASADVAVGYSDNVLASSAKMDSGYLQYQLDIDQTLSANENRAFGLYVAGRYRDYFRFINKWQATLGGSSWHRFMAGQLHSYNFIELSVVRDQLIPEDDCRGVNAGSQWRWFFDDQLSTAIEINYQSNDYRHKVADRQLLFINGTGNGKKNKGSNFGSGGAAIKQRSDQCWGVVLSGQYFFSADLSSELAAIVSTNHSNIDSESYDAIGAKNSWHYILHRDVSLMVAGSHLWRDYGRFSERELNLNIELIWRCSKSYSFYVRGEKRWNESPINHDNYSELTSVCGLNWSF